MSGQQHKKLFPFGKRPIRSPKGKSFFLNRQKALYFINA
jgi:hypothetical protein